MSLLMMVILYDNKINPYELVIALNLMIINMFGKLTTYHILYHTICIFVQY